MVELGVLDFLGVGLRDALFIAVGGSLVGLAPAIYRAGKETYEWGKAKVGGDKTQTSAELEQMRAAYWDLLEQIKKAAHDRLVPVKAIVQLDDNGTPVGTKLILDDGSVLNQQPIKLTEEQVLAVEEEFVKEVEPSLSAAEVERLRALEEELSELKARVGAIPPALPGAKK